MTADERTGVPLRFCTDDLPQRDRLPIWREVIGRTIAHLDLEPVGDGPFRSESVSRALPDLDLTSVSLTSVPSRRTREMITDGNDDILLMIIDDGRVADTQLGREVVVDAGTATLMSNADVSSVTASISKGHSLRVPRQALLLLATRLEDAFMRPLPRAGNALRLLRGYIATLEQMPPPIAPDLRHLMATHVHDLIALAIGTTGDAAELASGRGARAARFAAIKADIANNIARQDISADWIAPRHGVSPTTVRRLFEEDATTFSQFVLNYRLAYARRLLCRPRLMDRTISSIAFSVGFSDLSYFNRTFRRHYGATPSEVRDATQREVNGGGEDEQA